MMKNNNILDIMNLGDDSYLINYIPNKKDNEDEAPHPSLLFNNMSNFNISIYLSADITAYARIHMSGRPSRYGSASGE